MKFRPAGLHPRAGAVRLQGAPSGVPRRALSQQARVALRFEVTDALGEAFIPNAAVSLVFEDGTHIITKLTDAGGNVSFTESEIAQAAEAAFGPDLPEGVVWYTVEAPGYQMAEDIIWQPDVTTLADLQQVKTVALATAEAAPDKPNYVAAGITTALLIAVGVA